MSTHMNWVLWCRSEGRPPPCGWPGDRALFPWWVNTKWVLWLHFCLFIESWKDFDFLVFPTKEALLGYCRFLWDTSYTLTNYTTILKIDTATLTTYTTNFPWLRWIRNSYLRFWSRTRGRGFIAVSSLGGTRWNCNNVGTLLHFPSYYRRQAHFS